MTGISHAYSVCRSTTVWTAIPCAVPGASTFRVNGHEVLIASGGKFAEAAEAGLVVTLPGFDSGKRVIAVRRRTKRNNIGTKWELPFFSEEMTDPLVAFVGQWRPDLIVTTTRGRWTTDCR